MVFSFQKFLKTNRWTDRQTDIVTYKDDSCRLKMIIYLIRLHLDWQDQKLSLCWLVPLKLVPSAFLNIAFLFKVMIKNLLTYCKVVPNHTVFHALPQLSNCRGSHPWCVQSDRTILEHTSMPLVEQLRRDCSFSAI